MAHISYDVGMSYTIIARKPGSTINYPARTEKAALLKVKELRAAGFSVRIEGADGAETFETDLEDIMDAREGPDLNQRAKSIVDRVTRDD